jgi:C4-dicarboxylate-specific signal transduction histidine kinase
MKTATGSSPSKVDLNVLKKFRIFENCENTLLQNLLPALEVQSFETDQAICQEGEQSLAMYFIVKGQVLVSKGTVPLATLNELDYFGEMSLIGKIQHREATVTAYKPTLVYKVSTEVFDRFLKKSPQVLFELVTTYDNRLRKHNTLVIQQYKEIKDKYNELEEAHKQLLQTDKLASIGMLTAGIAHEINNPLTVLHGHIHFMEKHLSRETLAREKIQESLSKIKKAGQSISTIAANLKSFVHRDTGKTDAVDLNRSIQSTLDLCSFLYKKESIDITTEYDSNGPKVMGNDGQMQQVVMNLLSNAKDALEDCENKAIHIQTIEKEQSIELKVSDNGSGIKPENLKKIFEKFFTTKPVGRGTGLGLDIISSIVSKMNAQIAVDSEEKKGTCFTIKFPKGT